MSTEQNDPRDTFLADQAEGMSLAQTRDEQSWNLNIRNAEANAMAQECHAMHLASKAALLNAIAQPVAIMSIAASLHALKRLVTKR